MMRSMYSGVSGLRNHQMKMDVVGNNIANVNTVGFKKSRVMFKDALYQNIRGGSAPTTERGGTNPQAIGLGVTLASVDVIPTGGSTQTTGKNTDLSIDGNGYFVLQSGGQKFYTRAGNFDFDKLGNYLTPGNGLKVMGWQADMAQTDATGKWAIDSTGSLEGIDVTDYKTVNPKKTAAITFQGNCDSTAAPLADATHHLPALTSKEIYDSLGNAHTVYFRFEKMFADDNIADGGTTPGTVWKVRASMSSQCPVASSTDFLLLFDQFGNLQNTVTSAAGVTGAPVASDTLPAALADVTFPPIAAATPAVLKRDLAIVWTAAGVGAGVFENQTISLDFQNVFQHNATHTAYADTQDGYTKGSLRQVSIDQSGTILGSFSNGITQNLGRVALATFQNPAGLIENGGGLYTESNNSGDPKIGAPGNEDTGVLIPGSLEMSNVDLSEEFTEMIVTQRGFQANSRIITTSDEMLQELVNLKR